MSRNIHSLKAKAFSSRQNVCRVVKLSAFSHLRIFLSPSPQRKPISMSFFMCLNSQSINCYIPHCLVWIAPINSIISCSLWWLASFSQHTIFGIHSYYSVWVTTPFLFRDEEFITWIWYLLSIHSPADRTTKFLHVSSKCQTLYFCFKHLTLNSSKSTDIQLQSSISSFQFAQMLSSCPNTHQT